MLKRTVAYVLHNLPSCPRMNNKGDFILNKLNKRLTGYVDLIETSSYKSYHVLCLVVGELNGIVFMRANKVIHILYKFKI